MFFNAVVYMILQTGLTCCLCPDHYSKAMVWLRLFLCVLAVFAVIFTACLQYIGEALWSTEEAEHPKHLRVPGDPVRLMSVLVRFQTVQALNAAYSKRLDALNGASALTAVVSCLGMASVAAFPYYWNVDAE
ncbi:hypothetical protein IscW_ISCW007024 [Ixodes scapularis]|uniref:Uncharacterized protein n=1 Tax=Ixodes scapularis TaxID=6945 RepID=B7PT41_IXOSC|nr:hypothetical protein IscW_ISCW007024 [Ixodes scapularis]|eukprot:XP_002403823.1 hypothetical protein IscW_ISCW007024 [Ixodes scapularis]